SPIMIEVSSPEVLSVGLCVTGALNPGNGTRGPRRRIIEGGSARGRWIKGGVTSLSNTTTQSACRVAGARRPTRQSTATADARSNAARLFSANQANRKSFHKNMRSAHLNGLGPGLQSAALQKPALSYFLLSPVISSPCLPDDPAIVGNDQF